MRTELSRLLRRARRRPLTVLGIALAFTAYSAFWAFRRPQTYEAHVVVRMTEMVDFRLPRSRWSARELRGYVMEVAFTNKVLVEIFRKHLWDGKSPIDPVKAAFRIRDYVDLDVELDRTVMLSARPEEPRSARVTIGYRAIRGEQALGVVRALAQPIIETSARRRHDETEREQRRAREMVDEARARLESLTKQVLESVKKNPLPGERPLRDLGIESAIADARRRVQHLEERRTEAEKRSRIERDKPGIEVEITAETLESPVSRGPWIAGVALGAFVLALPLGSVVFAAFDPRVYSLHDVRRLGLPVLGHLRAAGRGRRRRRSLENAGAEADDAN